MGGVRQTLAQGTAFLTLSKVWEAFLGYALNLFLTRSLGPELFGLFGVIITVMLWLEICSFWAIPKKYLLTQIGIGVALALVLIAAPRSGRYLSSRKLYESFQIGRNRYTDRGARGHLYGCSFGPA